MAMKPLLPPELLAEMKELRESGLSYRKIGERLAVHYSVVAYHCNPATRLRLLESNVRWRKENPERLVASRKRQNIRALARRYAAEEGCSPEVYYRRWKVETLRQTRATP
jgi:hypothetical protein